MQSAIRCPKCGSKNVEIKVTETAWYKIDNIEDDHVEFGLESSSTDNTKVLKIDCGDCDAEWLSESEFAKEWREKYIVWKPQTGRDSLFFRELTAEEVEASKQWARENFKPGEEPNELWHPVVQEEWNKLQEQHDGTTMHES